MIERKAKLLHMWRDKNPFNRYPAVHFEYEYRGYTYIITDEHNGYSEPMWVKHKNEQDRIDRIIELEEKQAARGPVRYEDTAQAGIDAFFRYIDGEESEVI